MTSTNTHFDQKYVVYNITYSGDKLPSKNNSNISPSNYIGSTSIEHIKKGYMGSVSSKKYKNIWKSELKNNLHLFKLEIISYHDTRKEALWKELESQKIFNVVKNPLFVNMSYATPNGYFGSSIFGEDHQMFGKKGILSPNFGRKDSIETKAKKSKSATGFQHSPETKEKLSIINKGKVGEKSQNFGLKRSIEVKQNKSKQEQKFYQIITPDGESFTILGMKKFCIENNLNYSSMYQVSSNKIKHHKGWKCHKI
jgi:hypothetical protein